MIPLFFWLALAGTDASSTDALRPSLLSIRLLETPLAEAATQFGRLGPRVTPSRSSATAAVGYCFANEHDSRPAYLVLESGAPGGFGSVVSAIVLSERPPPVRMENSGAHPANAEALCPAARLVNARLTFSNGLHLGMSRSDIKRLLGNTTRRSGMSLVFERDDRPTVRPHVEEGRGAASDLTRISIVVQHGRAVRIRVERSGMM